MSGRDDVLTHADVVNQVRSEEQARAGKRIAELEAELKARDEKDRYAQKWLDLLEKEFHTFEYQLRTQLHAALADVERLTRERDELRRANEGLLADATRLDWIEANAAVDQWNHSVGAVTTVFSRRISPRPIRETIDAVMRGKSDG